MAKKMIDRLAGKHRCVRKLLEELDTLRGNVAYYERELGLLRAEKRKTLCRDVIASARKSEERADLLQNLFDEAVRRVTTKPSRSVEAFIDTVLPGGGPWPEGMVATVLMPADQIGGRLTLSEIRQVYWANGSCTWVARDAKGNQTTNGLPTASRAVSVLNDNNANHPNPKHKRRARQVRTKLGVE
jgi:hypothetical protein